MKLSELTIADLKTLIAFYGHKIDTMDESEEVNIVKNILKKHDNLLTSQQKDNMKKTIELGDRIYSLAVKRFELLRNELDKRIIAIDWPKSATDITLGDELEDAARQAREDFNLAKIKTKFSA